LLADIITAVLRRFYLHMFIDNYGPCYRSTQIGLCVKRQLLCLIVTKSGMCGEGAAAKRRTVHMPCNRRRGSRDASLECRRDSNEPKNYFCYTAC